MRARAAERGITYLEVIATAGLLAILAMAILPTATATHRKAKEIELQRALRQIRDCIDEYHYRCDQGIPPPGDGIKIGKNIGVGCGEPTWPEKLTDLLESPVIGATTDKKWRCLRKVPKDPMTEDGLWELECQDKSESMDSCRSGIFSLHSKSERKELAGERKYSEW